MIALAVLLAIFGLAFLVHAPPLVVSRLVRWAVLRRRHIRPPRIPGVGLSQVKGRTNCP